MATTSAAFKDMPGDQILLPIILGDGTAIHLRHTVQDKGKKKQPVYIVGETIRERLLNLMGEEYETLQGDNQ